MGGSDTWNGGSDNWNTVADWDDGLPGSTSDAIINSGNPQITSNEGAIAGLTVAGALQFIGGSLSVTGAAYTSGHVYFDSNGGQGGSAFAVGGTLINSGEIDIGNGSLSSSDQITANGLNNTGRIYMSGSAANQALLNINAAAGFGTTGEVTGSVYLGYYAVNSVVEFASGQINAVDSGALLDINSSTSFVADAGSLTSNSALTGLSSNAGRFSIENNATVAPTGDFNNTGQVQIDNTGGGQGGSDLAISGVLTNSGEIDLGTGSLSSSDKITANGLNNTGRIYMGGTASSQALLNINAAAGFGATGEVTGSVYLGYYAQNSVVEFASGQINAVESGATLDINSSTSFVADAGSLTSNSALTGLTSNAGRFSIEDNATVAPTGDFANSGQVQIDNTGGGQGGSDLAIAGVLTNSGEIDIGNGSLSSSDKITANGLNNTGRIYMGGTASSQALLNINAAAGFGTTGEVTGSIYLGYYAQNSVVEFASGQINAVESGATLDINSGNSFVADAGSLTSNSALTGLTSNAGRFSIENDATVAPTGDLNNTGQVQIDNTGGGQGGSDLAITGVLTNSGEIDIGNGNLASSDKITANGLNNTGRIYMSGSASSQALLDINAAAGFGATGEVTGSVVLGYYAQNSLVEFASGQINAVESGAALDINSGNSFVADAGSLTSNSALTGLTSNAGRFSIENDVTVAPTGAFANSGQVQIDNTGGGQGGSDLAISGVLTNSGEIDIGNGNLASSDKITANGLNNTGRIYLSGSASSQALLDINAAAGFGAAGKVTGSVVLGYYAQNSLVEFASGQINAVESGAALDINSGNSFVADAGSLTSNSALIGLTSNAGTFNIENDVTVAPTGPFNNSGTVNVDSTGGGQGGSDFGVSGALTNSGGFYIGNGNLSANDTASSASLLNTGTLALDGSVTLGQAKLAVTNALRNDGALDIDANAVVDAGSYQQDQGGQTTIQIQGTSAGDYGTLQATGGVTLNGGTLNTSTANYNWAAGDTFDLITFAAGQLVGMFSYLGNQTDGATYNLGNGLLLGFEYDDHAGLIEEKVVAAPTSTADTWTGGSADWSVAANWSGGAPDFYSAATISTSAAATVTLSTDKTIDSLTLGAHDTLSTKSGTDLSIGTNLSVAGALTVGGEAFVDGATTNTGVITANGYVLDLRGAISGTGGLAIGANAKLELGSTDAETVTFKGANATLKLDNPAGFTGALANLVVGDRLDLAGIVAIGPTVTNNTTLAFTDAAGGQYSYALTGFPGGAGFVAQSDGAGGTYLIVTPPTTTVTINPVGGNNVINHAQASAGLTVTGAVSGLAANATFSLKIVDGSVQKTYVATVGAGGTTWSAAIPAGALTALPDGAASFTAYVSASIQASQSVAIHETAPVVTISAVDGNDVINAAQAQGSVTLSGGSTGLAAGATFTVNVADGAFSGSYQATVGGNGNWSATIPTADATKLPNGVGAATVSAVATDAYGNASATVSRKVTVEETVPTLTLHAVDGNNVINSAQASAGVTVSGGSTGLAKGATFTVNLADGAFAKGYTATVGANGAWSAFVPAADAVTLPNGSHALTVSAQTTDAYGNATTLVSEQVTVGGNRPTVTLNPIDGNDAIYAANASAGIALSGSSTGLSSGATFSVAVTDGAFSKSYTATVGANGAWTASIPAADAKSLPNGTATFSAQATDAFGNVSAIVKQSVTVAENPPTISAPSGATVIGATASALGGLAVVDSNASDALTVTLTAQTGVLASNQYGGGAVAGDGTNTLTLSGSVADVNAELASVTYTGLPVAGQAGTTLADTLALSLSDTNGDTASASVAVTVAQASKSTPIITSPAMISDKTGVATILTGISLSDPYGASIGAIDAVTIALPGAILNASDATAMGVTVTGQGTASLTLTGTQDALNKVLLESVSATVGSTATSGTVSVNPASGPYDFIDFSKNGNIQSTLLSEFPTGVVYADNALGTPFDITSNASGDNFAEISGTLTVPVNIPAAYTEPGGGGVEEVDMLTNAFAPPSNGATLETVEFDGVDGSGNFVKETFTVVDGQTVRDIFQTNDVNVATTLNTSAAAPAALNAFTYNSVGGATANGGASGTSTNGATGIYTVDEQRFVLDPDFATASLQQIIITPVSGGGTPLLLGITLRETPSVLDAGETGDQYDERVKMILDPDPDDDGDDDSGGDDDIFPPPPPDIPPSTDGGPTGQGNGHNGFPPGGNANGDVHITTYDGLYYNFQAEGEFILTQSTVAGDKFEVQVRLQPWTTTSSVSVITEAAVQVGSDHVTFDINRPDLIWIDGVASHALSGAGSSVALNGGELLQISSSQFEVVLNAGETVTVTDNGSFLNVSPTLSASQGANSVKGLLGADAGQANDFQLADGTVLSQPLTQAELYGEYANAWRVTDANSILDYGPNQTTATFTDVNFPDDAIALASLPQQVIAAAAAVVAAAGITDPTVAQGAELDYLATGDLSFVTSAAQANQAAPVNQAAIVQTSAANPLPAIGVVASHPSVTAAATGVTAVTFSVYLTAAAGAATTIDYAVIAPDADTLGTSAFGTLPSGQVVIPQGGTTGQVTIDVPQGALGALDSAKLDLQISSPSGNPVFSGTAETTLVSPTAAPHETGATFSAPAQIVGVGSVVQIALTFDEPVTVSGKPTLTLNDGGVATYAGSGGGFSSTLIFDYTVAASDSTAAGKGLQVVSLQTSGGSIANVAGVAASLTLASGDIAGPEVDSAAPTITGTLAGQTTAKGASVTPFAGVVIADGNTDDTDALTITLSGDGGTLSGAGLLTGKAGAFGLVGSAAEITSELQALQFTAAAPQAGGSPTTTFTLSDKSYTDSVATTDSVTTVTVTAPTVAINPIDGNDVINAANAAAGVAISGTSTGLATGATFSVSVTDGAFAKFYVATVGANGNWTAAIPASDATTLPNGTATFSAQATDVHGNVSATATQTVTVTQAAAVTINPIDGDDVINYAQAHASAGVRISGTLSGAKAGAKFNVTVVDGAFQATYVATVGANGVWTATIPTADASALADGKATVTAETGATASQTVTVAETRPLIASLTQTPATGDLDAGKTVVFTMTTSAAVTVTGAPRLFLNDGGRADFNAAASSATKLVFDYTVAAGENVAALAATLVYLNGGSIDDANGNAAVLSLASLTQHGPEVDTKAPVFTGVTETPTTGKLGLGKTVMFYLSTDEAVKTVGKPTLTLNDGGTAAYVAASSTSTKLAFRYFVAAGQTSSDLEAVSVNLAGGSVADLAGNALNPSLAHLAQAGPAVSGVPASVKAIVETPATGDLDAGKTGKITLTLSAPVTVTGAPKLLLDDAGSATYDAALSTSTSLVFTYTVAAGQNTPALTAHLVYLNGGSVIDAFGNAANLAIAGLTQAGPKIDTAAPKFTALVEQPSTGDLRAGAIVTLSLFTSEAVKLTGAPTLKLNDGGVATYDAAASTSTKLVFDDTVLAGQNVAALSAVSVSLNGGTLTDLAGNAAVLSLAGLVQKGPEIDTKAPTVLSFAGSASGDLLTGQTDKITIGFSEAVRVTGSPKAILNDGGFATYEAGSGTNTLTFDYKLLAGQTTPDLEIVGAAFGSGSAIADFAGNPLALPPAPLNLGVEVNNYVNLTNGETYAIVGASNENADFAAGAAAHLVLTDSHLYTGAITGFAPTDTLDLLDLSFGTKTKVSFSGSTNGGTLAVTDGVHQAAIALLGDYTGATFTASNDGYGGVQIVDPQRQMLAIAPTAA